MNGGTALVLAGCQATPAPLYQPPPHPAAIVDVTARGWHTGLALPTRPLGQSWRAVLQEFPEAEYLLFGWGELNYYMAPHPSSGDALRALFPGPAVLLVTPLRGPPAAVPTEQKVFALSLTSQGFDRMQDFVRAAFARSPNGQPQRVGNGPTPGSLFFAATGTYSADRTCNTWVAEALRQGGLPVSAKGVVFADAVVSQVRRLAVPPNG